MAKLILENFDDELLEKLKLKASLNDRSVEAELTSILRRVLSRRTEQESLKHMLLSMSRGE